MQAGRPLEHTKLKDNCATKGAQQQRKQTRQGPQARAFSALFTHTHMQAGSASLALASPLPNYPASSYPTRLQLEERK
jgi:hypothetical protein